MENEMSPENTEKLVQFQELSGIEDLENCKGILERHGWDVQAAIHHHLGPDPGEFERVLPVYRNNDHLPNENGRSINGMAAERPQIRNAPGQGIVSLLLSPFAEIWSTRNQRPGGLAGWIFFFTFFPIRVVLVTFHQITNFVLKLIRPSQRPAVTDPSSNVLSFIQEYERTYGFRHPHFYVGTYNQVLNEAKKELKFLLVYLHCKEHQDTDRFCLRTLANPQVIRYINENCLMWGCSVDTLEGYRVSQSLRENTYPFIAVIVQREFRMTVVGRIEGYVDSESFIHRIATIISDNEAFLVAARADREERSFTQALRQEQDQAYLESLRADQEKEERKRRERLLEEERLKEVEEMKLAEERKKEELTKRKVEAVSQVPAEPSPDSEGICRILVRLPRGQKLERRFLRTIHTLKDLYYFILSHPDSPYEFEMVTSFPKRTLPWQPGTDANPTLAEVGLGASEALLVLDLDA